MRILAIRPWPIEANTEEGNAFLKATAADSSIKYKDLIDLAQGIRRQKCFEAYIDEYKKNIAQGQESSAKRPSYEYFAEKCGCDPGNIGWLEHRVNLYEATLEMKEPERGALIKRLFGPSQANDELRFEEAIQEAALDKKLYDHRHGYRLFEEFCTDGDYLTFKEMFKRENCSLTTINIDRNSSEKVVSAADIKEFYVSLLYVLKKHNISWQNVYNADEIGFSEQYTRIIKKIVIPKGSELTDKCLKSIDCDKAFLETICATGTTAIPPFLVFGKRRAPKLPSSRRTCGIPLDWNLNVNEHGWIEEKQFVEYLKHFNQHTGGSEFKRILILDNCKVHKAREVREYAAANNIFIIELPPFAAHILQPIDLVYFSQFKQQFNEKFARLSWMKQKNNNDVLKVIRACREEAHERAKFGFEDSGIFPFNPNKLFELNGKFVSEWEKYFVSNEPIELQFKPLGGPEYWREPIDADILALVYIRINAAVSPII